MSGSAADVLNVLAAQLREEDTPISPHVVDPVEQPEFGPLVAAGPRAAAAPAEYALVIESVREGYLLHYGVPRLLAGHDDDLALLAGDYLYALGIERLAALGDAEAVRAAGRPDQPLRPAARRGPRGRGARPLAELRPGDCRELTPALSARCSCGSASW